MKNADVALAGEYIECLDGKRREFRVSTLMMCLLQEHYRNNGFPDFVFYRHFDWEKHLYGDIELTALLLWAGLASYEKEKGTFDEWTLEKCKSVFPAFSIPEIIDVIQKAAAKGLSEDQKKALEVRAKKKTVVPRVKKQSKRKSNRRV